MTTDIQRVAIKRLLDTQDSDLNSKLQPTYFSSANRTIYDSILSFYKANNKLPNVQEISIIKADPAIRNYFEEYVLSDDNNLEGVSNTFLVAQLQDYYIRDVTIEFVDNLLTNLDSLEKVEILDKFQGHIQNLNKAIPHDEELYDVGELGFFPSEEDFNIYPSGLSAEYDATNGGFATQELILLGGRRGSGKSIISLNLAMHRFLQGNTVAFFTIEMRYKEVYDRVLSIVSGVPFLDIFKNQLSVDQKIQIARSKLSVFYKPSDIAATILADLEKTLDFKKFEHDLKLHKPPLTDHRLLFIDDEGLTLNRIDHYCDMFKSKYPNFNMAVVDYINIIKHEDQKDWKTQIIVAEGLKGTSRRHDLTVVSPYQIDASGEARFAKGILDSADRSFNFFPPPENEDRSLESKIVIHTTKMRNGKHMSFDVPMDWACVKINPNQSHIINEKPLNAVKYGTDAQGGPKDV